PDIDEELQALLHQADADGGGRRGGDRLVLGNQQQTRVLAELLPQRSPQLVEGVTPVLRVEIRDLDRVGESYPDAVDDLLTVGHMVIQGPGGHAHLAGETVHGDGHEALLAGDGEGTVDDGLDREDSLGGTSRA